MKEDVARRLLQVLGKLIDVAKDGDTRVGKAGPAGHLHHQAAARILHDVARVDGQRGEAEYGVARLIRRKVHQRAEGVPRSPVVHPRHHRAQVRKLRLLHLRTPLPADLSDCPPVSPSCAVHSSPKKVMKMTLVRHMHACTRY